MRISKNGIELIKHFESLHDGDLSVIGLQPKMCPAGIWTVGYGHALRGEDGEYLRGLEDKDKAYAQYPNLTEKEAMILLDEDCDVYEGRLSSLGIPLLQNEFDALVSFCYNVGFANFKQSSLYKYISSGNRSPETIQWGFSLWNKARVNGVLQPLPGLTRRRKSEAVLFSTGKLVFA